LRKHNVFFDVYCKKGRNQEDFSVREAIMERKKGGLTRRGFITAAAGGIVGAGMAGLVHASPAGGQKEEESGAEPKGKAITRMLGKTGIEIPVVSMGVMNSNNPEIVRAAYETGFRHFDTAAYYMGGKNERMVGEVIKELGVRDNVIIATKVYAPNMRVGDTAAETRRKIRIQIDECLNRLQMSHVDILYVHNVDSAGFVMNEAVHEAMEEARASGRTRFTGISTHKQMSEVIDAVTKSGWYDVVLTVINMTMADNARLLDSIKNAAKKGVGIVAMKTQVGGRRFPLPESIAGYDGRTINQAALRWVIRNEDIATAIPGFTTFEHMKEDFDVAYSLEFNEKEKSLLGECDLKVGMAYCRQCGLCLADCPAGVHVPTLMRTHMYAAQYANFQHARATLGEIEAGRGLERCSGCGACAVRCRHSVDVAARIEELKLIYA
jgi:predicted aldo/keto reductase-like oxidoreductase